MIYEQTTGKLWDGDKLIGTGWAGHLEGKNNPSLQAVKNVGPLPQGFYQVSDPVQGTHLGPFAFPLVPAKETVTFGRGGFYIHGASAVNTAMSSDGCIIQTRPTREYIATKIGGSPKDSPLRLLQVVK